MDLARTQGGDRLRITLPRGVRPTAVLRLLLLGAAVFTAAALAGALLAGAAPAGSYQRSPGGAGSAGAAALPGTSSASMATGERYRWASATDRAFALSMVYSGATALTLSIIGLVIVGRQRRYW